MIGQKKFIYLALVVAAMVFVQLNFHNLMYFIGASLLVGLMPFRQMNFLKYLGIEWLALLGCMFIQNPSLVFVNSVGSISNLGGVGYVLAVFVVSGITFALCATTIYVFLTKKYILKPVRSF